MILTPIEAARRFLILPNKDGIFQPIRAAETWYPIVSNGELIGYTNEPSRPYGRMPLNIGQVTQ